MSEHQTIDGAELKVGERIGWRLRGWSELSWREKIAWKLKHPFRRYPAEINGIYKATAVTTSDPERRPI